MIFSSGGGAHFTASDLLQQRPLSSKLILLVGSLEFDAGGPFMHRTGRFIASSILEAPLVIINAT
ncbi:hypothetical protein DCO45_19825 [Comamonas sp. JNW]|nr:hypothetical protein DCO45_19825 [Comamonas sp. JNW]